MPHYWLLHAGGEPRAAEMARELLPERYPYVSEFRAALQLDPDNIELRRELGYLLLRMESKQEAEGEFAFLVGACAGRSVIRYATGLPALGARGNAPLPCLCSNA